MGRIPLIDRRTTIDLFLGLFCRCCFSCSQLLETQKYYPQMVKCRTRIGPIRYDNIHSAACSCWYVFRIRRLNWVTIESFQQKKVKFERTSKPGRVILTRDYLDHHSGRKLAEIFGRPSGGFHMEKKVRRWKGGRTSWSELQPSPKRQGPFRSVEPRRRVSRRVFHVGSTTLQNETTQLSIPSTWPMLRNWAH